MSAELRWRRFFYYFCTNDFSDDCSCCTKGYSNHPDFVIEVISKNDQAEKLVKRMGDYWAAGVQVIWQIYPENKQIHVYHGKNMTVCRGDDLCSAEPVVPAFVLPVKEVFK